MWHDQVQVSCTVLSSEIYRPSCQVSEVDFGDRKDVRWHPIGWSSRLLLAEYSTYQHKTILRTCSSADLRASFTAHFLAKETLAAIVSPI